MKLHLVDINPDMCAAWEDAFAVCPEVEIIQGNILYYAVDCIVSPANSYGHMDGGIDELYTKYFGNQLQVRLIEEIMRRFSKGLLPVGKALLMRTKDEKIPFMISAPTMEGPMSLERPHNVFFAMNAMLSCAEKNRELIHDIYCPGLGTGVGRVPFEAAAQEMVKAFRKHKNFSVSPG